VDNSGLDPTVAAKQLIRQFKQKGRSKPDRVFRQSLIMSEVKYERPLAACHADVSTTMIYTHVLNTPGLSARSPVDSL